MCAAGTYANASLGATSCIPCPKGTYGSSSGANSESVCAPCSAGTFNDVLGSSARSACLRCGLGTYSFSGSENCLSCPAGSWSNKIGAFSCNLCPAGSSSFSSGAYNQSTCTACGPGFFSSAVGSAVCSPCPAGRYCASLTSDGVACPPGTYSQYTAASSNASCLRCPAGHYCPSSGTISPIPCVSDGGFYSAVSGASNSSECSNQACPAGHFCQPGASSPTACPAGFFFSNTGAASISSCQLCNISLHKGHYCPGDVTSKLSFQKTHCEKLSSFIVRRNQKSTAMCCWSVLRWQRLFSAWSSMRQRHIFICDRRQLLCSLSAVPSRQLLPH
jgi:hypothetical protein